jgi:hypothetical protein
MLIYSAMAVSPLAAFAAKSDRSARAVIGECSGDCAVCGCSPERSASHTCCCWQKKLTSHCNIEDHSAECGMETEPDTTVPVLSACPCGSNKMLPFWGENEYQLLPDQFTASLVLLEKPLFSPEQERLISRNCEPPDQPPELSNPA